MVRNLKALMYSGSINGANFTSFMGVWGELCKICMIRWKFAEKTKLKFENFACKFENFAHKFKDEETNVYS